MTQTRAEPTSSEQITPEDSKCAETNLTILATSAKRAASWVTTGALIPITAAISNRKGKLESPWETINLNNSSTIETATNWAPIKAEEAASNQVALHKRQTLHTSFQIKRSDKAREGYPAKTMQSRANNPKAIKAKPVSWARFHLVTRKIEIWAWTNTKLKSYQFQIWLSAWILNTKPWPPVKP